MKPEIIFEHPKLKLTYYPIESAILETWNGFTDFNLFAELLDKTIALMIEKKAKNLILDTRGHKGLGPDGQQHGAKVCIEHAKKYGTMKHAIILPTDAFSKLSVNNFVTNVDKQNGKALVINAYFKEINAALDWMKED